ncbi:hypothetical protein KFE98_07460 [bacterium SCSIO 12741]|nr:hypothetical protein KFE98_07460 [bacterium SCSIO 12741]
MNYESRAVRDDGSCVFEYEYGCTDHNANNYDIQALYDDGSCRFDVDQFEGSYYVSDTVVGIQSSDTSIFSYQMRIVKDGDNTKRMVFWGLSGLVPREAVCRADVNDTTFSVRGQVAGGDRSWGRFEYLLGSGELKKDTLRFEYKIRNDQNEEYFGFGKAVR